MAKITRDNFKDTFTPSKVEYKDDDHVTLIFNKGDIQVFMKEEVFTLDEDGSTMLVRIHRNKIMNKDKFTFRSDRSNRLVVYDARHVKAFGECARLLSKVVNNFINGKVEE